MAGSERLVRAVGGCAQMGQALDASLASAKVAVSDEDFPTGLRGDMREAVRAVEYARKRIAAVSQGLIQERIAGAKGAQNPS